MKIPYTHRHIKNTTAFIILLVVLLIGAIIFRFFTPATTRVIEALPFPKITSNSLFSALPTTIQIREEFTSPTVAQRLPVYAVTVKKIELETYASLFGATKQLSSQSYSNASGTVNLTEDLTTNQILLTQNVREHLDVSQMLAVDTQKEVAKATTFIQDTLLLKSYVANTDNIKYYSLDSDGDYLDVSTQENARVVTIPFFLSIGGNRAFFENQFDAPILMYVNSAHSIIKAIFTPYQITQKESYEVDTVSASQALTKLYANVVVGLYRENSERINSQDVRELTITEVSVEYRLDSKSNTILPMYRYSGNAVTKQNDEAAVVFLLPAIQTQ
jgi:hypothetical protein